jgi:hypothetical protein
VEEIGAKDPLRLGVSIVVNKSEVDGPIRVDEFVRVINGSAINPSWRIW